MKILVCSDIHGSITNLDLFMERINSEKPDRVVILGDLYPYGYPSESIIYELGDRLNNINNLTVIRGNCDYEDSYFSFKFVDRLVLSLNNKIFYFCHGHINNKNNPPDLFDVLVYGHEHIGYIKKNNDKLFINAGSIGNPRYGSPRSYLVITDEDILLKGLEGNIIDYISYK